MMKAKKTSSQILVINGSPAGKRGNCAQFIRKNWPQGIGYDVLHLAEVRQWSLVFKRLMQAPAVVFVTGTYWDSWGSPLQVFLEKFTMYEADPRIMGKPVACMVLMHSVGGKGVLSRLQGVLNTFGFLLPPMSGMVFSLVSQQSFKVKNSHALDLWSEEDVNCLIANLKIAMEMNHNSWQEWGVDRKNPRRIWISRAK